MYRAPVFRRHDGVALSQQFPEHIGEPGRKIAVDAAVGKNDEGLLLLSIQIFGDKNVCPKPPRVAGPLSGGVGLISERRTCDPGNVDLGDISESMEEHEVIHLPGYLIESVTEVSVLSLQLLVQVRHGRQRLFLSAQRRDIDYHSNNYLTDRMHSFFHGVSMFSPLVLQFSLPSSC